MEKILWQNPSDSTFETFHKFIQKWAYIYIHLCKMKHSFI